MKMNETTFINDNNKDTLEEKIERMEELEREDGLGNDEVGTTVTVQEEG